MKMTLKLNRWLHLLFCISFFSTKGLCDSLEYTLIQEGEDITIDVKKPGNGIKDTIQNNGVITNKISDITCYVTRENKKTLLVKWNGAPEMMNTCRRRCNVTTNQFQLGASKKFDTGKYECHFTLSNAGLSWEMHEYINVIVTDSEVRPTISLNTTEVQAGMTVKLTCDTHSLAKYSLKVTWRKDNKVLRSEDWSPIRGNEALLKNVKDKDAGSYTCEMFVRNPKPSDVLVLKLAPADFSLPAKSTERPSTASRKMAYPSPQNAGIKGRRTHQASLNNVAIVGITALVVVIVSVITARLRTFCRKRKSDDEQDLRVQMKPQQALEDLRRPSEVSNGPGSPTSVVYATIDDDMVKSDLKPEEETGNVTRVLSTYVLSSGDSFEVISDADVRDSEVINVRVDMVDMCENPIYVHSEESSCDAKKNQPAKQDVFVYDHIGGLNLPASSRNQRGVSPTRGLETRSEKEAGREEEDTFRPEDSEFNK